MHPSGHQIMQCFSWGRSRRHPFLMQTAPLLSNMLPCTAAICSQCKVCLRKAELPVLGWESLAFPLRHRQPLCHLELVSNQSWGQIVRDEPRAAQWKLH